jgi:hypothetical protein
MNLQSCVENVIGESKFRLIDSSRHDLMRHKGKTYVLKCDIQRDAGQK